MFYQIIFNFVSFAPFCGRKARLRKNSIVQMKADGIGVNLSYGFRYVFIQ